MPFFIGLDQALANTGYAVVHIALDKLGQNELSVVEWGVIETTNQHSYAERLVFIQNQVDRLILTYWPKYLFTEEVFTPRGKAANSWPLLLQVESAIHMLAVRRNITCTRTSSEVNKAHSWRKVFGLPGDKKVAQDYLESRVGERLNSHVADAWLIAIASLQLENLITDARSVTLRVNPELKLDWVQRPILLIQENSSDGH